MSIFLDTSELHEIDQFLRMGIIRGVTTNPTIMLKDGVTGGLSGVKERTRTISQMVHPLPVSVEVTSNEIEDIIHQAKDFASLSENIIVKIPVHGPHGELHNMEAIHELETTHNIRVNSTAMMNAQQCFLSALSGASYVSIFGGRVNNMGYNVCGEISKLRKILDSAKLNSKIIVGSTREILNIVEWLEAGAHIVTVVPNILKGMLVHPYSKETIQMFLRDANSVNAI